MAMIDRRVHNDGDGTDDNDNCGCMRYIGGCMNVGL